MVEYKMLRVHKSTWERLNEVAGKGDSYNSVILWALDALDKEAQK